MPPRLDLQGVELPKGITIARANKSNPYHAEFSHKGRQVYVGNYLTPELALIGLDARKALCNLDDKHAIGKGKKEKDTPMGVGMKNNSKHNPYEGRFRHNGKKVVVGLFSTAELAFEAVNKERGRLNLELYLPKTLTNPNPNANMKRRLTGGAAVKNKPIDELDSDVNGGGGFSAGATSSSGGEGMDPSNYNNNGSNSSGAYNSSTGTSYINNPVTYIGNMRYVNGNLYGNYDNAYNSTSKSTYNTSDNNGYVIGQIPVPMPPPMTMSQLPVPLVPAMPGFVPSAPVSRFTNIGGDIGGGNDSGVSLGVGIPPGLRGRKRPHDFGEKKNEENQDVGAGRSKETLL